MFEFDDLRQIMDEHNTQFGVWIPVPEDIDNLFSYMREDGIGFFEDVWVYRLFNDGSGSVTISHLIPVAEVGNGYHAEWEMTPFAAANGAKITHYMKRPLPPVEYRKEKTKS